MTKLSGVLVIALIPTLLWASPKASMYPVDDDACGEALYFQVDYPLVLKGEQFSHLVIRIESDDGATMFESSLARSDSQGSYFCVSKTLIENVTVELIYGHSFCGGPRGVYVADLRKFDSVNEIEFRTVHESVSSLKNNKSECDLRQELEL